MACGAVLVWDAFGLLDVCKRSWTLARTKLTVSTVKFSSLFLVSYEVVIQLATLGVCHEGCIYLKSSVQHISYTRSQSR